MATATEPLIAVAPAGVSVYGVAQNAYSVREGGALKATTYDMAIATASLQRSFSIESAMSAATAIVRIKQEKMAVLSDLLALLTQGRAALPTESPKPTDSVTVEGLSAKAELLKTKYGIEVVVGTNNAATRENIEKGTVVVQSAIDETDNQLQQDMLTLQNWVSKRDESFRSATKALKTVLGTGSAIINNIGG